MNDWENGMLTRIASLLKLTMSRQFIRGRASWKSKLTPYIFISAFSFISPIIWGQAIKKNDEHLQKTIEQRSLLQQAMNIISNNKNISEVTFTIYPHERNFENNKDIIYAEKTGIVCSTKEFSKKIEIYNILINANIHEKRNSNLGELHAKSTDSYIEFKMLNGNNVAFGFENKDISKNSIAGLIEFDQDNNEYIWLSGNSQENIYRWAKRLTECKIPVYTGRK